MRLINANTVVTIQTYDDMYEEWKVETMTVAEAMDKWSDEGCPPTIDAEPVRHGRWEETRVIGYDGIYPVYAQPCSECGYMTELYKLNYCPNCGAKMNKGVQNDQN